MPSLFTEVIALFSIKGLSITESPICEPKNFVFLIVWFLLVVEEPWGFWMLNEQQYPWYVSVTEKIVLQSTMTPSQRHRSSSFVQGNISFFIVKSTSKRFSSKISWSIPSSEASGDSIWLVNAATYLTRLMSSSAVTLKSSMSYSLNKATFNRSLTLMNILHLQRFHQCGNLRICNEVWIAKSDGWKFDIVNGTEVRLHVDSSRIWFVSH